MKILLTGANGNVGGELRKSLLNSGDEVLTLGFHGLRERGIEDLCEIAKGCEYIIHCGANTDLEFCELNPLAAYTDISFLTEKLVTVAARNSLRFLYISSTGVYGDYKPSPYTEYDVAIPLSVHHKAKLSAEKIVSLLPRSLILRTGWIFGGDIHNKKNFVVNRMNEMKSSSTNLLHANAIQYGCPTFVMDLIACIRQLMCSDLYGIFNCVNEGNASRMEYIQAIAANLEIDIEIVRSCDFNFKRVAIVSNNEMALNFKLNALGVYSFPCWQNSLEKYCDYVKKVY